jgi:alpha-glucosidase
VNFHFRTFALAVLLPGCVASLHAASRTPLDVISPDGLVTARFDLKPDPVYSIWYRGTPLLLDSGLALVLESGARFGPGFALESVKETSHSGSWKPVYGERSEIPENYREAVIRLKGPDSRLLDIVIRAYNEGAAIRYVLPQQDGLKDFVITSEQTEFHLPAATRAWETHGAQSPFENVWVKDIQPGCERPLTLEYPDGKYAALVEAGVRNYPRMLLSPAKTNPWTLVSQLSNGPTPIPAFDPEGGTRPSDDRASKPYAWGSTPFATPWRALIVGDRAGDLLERNYLLLNLNESSVIGDASWIKPGKVIREVTLSTKGGKECVDFAKAHNLQYVEYDASWYGPEGDSASDASGVHLDPQHASLDLKEVIRYGKENGVGVILYVNQRALEKQRSSIFPLYEQWGVKGIKFGFVNVGSQFWTNWLYDGVALAARNHLMVDIHDEHRPTGLSRTYPNLLTQEGIAGNETMPTADHNTTVPFTRFLAGAADYTICYYVDRIKTTRAQQLALAAIYYSPLQFMYWYDRPAAAHGEPEIEFFDKIPTVWDETKVLNGEVGRYITVARRSGNDWFAGSITNSVPRRLNVRLSFLPAGRKYIAHIYENGHGTKDVKVSTREVDSRSVIVAALAEAGGQAIWLQAK